MWTARDHHSGHTSQRDPVARRWRHWLVALIGLLALLMVSAIEA